ncbi:MAG TPA: serine/threonine-protein kinase [Gemmatimonadales bacterium]
MISSVSDGLPADMLRDCSRRLGIACAVWGGLWIMAALLYNIVAPIIAPAGLDGPWPWPGNAVAAVSVLISAALFLYTRRTTCDTQLSLDLGLAYEITLALGIAMVTQWTPGAARSWIPLLILVHPILVPNTPRKTLLAALLAASMDPAGVAVAAARGVAVPPPGELALLFLPNYVAAFLAVLPAHLITRLGRAVNQARQVGNYELRELLGAGGMAEVYRAEHRLLRRPAAVKLIKPGALQTPGASRKVLVERFWREAEAATSLTSPHTIALYDFGVTGGGRFFYVMELLNGVDLETLVQRTGPLPAARVIYLLQQACRSLAEAHARGFIHRDIKPANLYVCRIGLQTDFLKVLDFGLVTSASDGTSEQLRATMPGVVTGTPAYMAPEMALGERDIDHRVDVYALGAVAYWLLTGQTVFEARTPVQMMLQHVQRAPTPPSRRTELRIPESLEQLVLACLAKDPKERPGDALELARRLGACPVDEPWTPELGERWWRTNLPDLGQSATPQGLWPLPSAARI